MSTTTNPLGLKSEPPLNEAPHDGLGMPTQAWASWFLDASDRLNKLQIGVTDGSEAKAGNIGEYMTASASAPLTTTTVANVVSLSLTAGDWDVQGNVTFTATSGTHTFFGAGVGTLDTFTSATFASAALNMGITTATRRYNVTGTTTVWVVAEAGFGGGTVTAAGAIRARRMR